MFKYGMIERECGMGCQPNRFKMFEHCDKNKTGFYSYVWYDRELTQKELFDYSMVFIERV